MFKTRYEAQRQTHAHMDTLFLKEKARIYNGEQIVTSISGPGKTGQLCAKHEIRTLANNTHRNKLKMD